MEKNSKFDGSLNVICAVMANNICGLEGLVWALSGREVAKVNKEQEFWMHPMVESLIGEELASFWALNKAFWSYDSAENMISTNMVEAVQASYHEEEIHGLLAGQKDIEFQIEERKAIVSGMNGLKKTIVKICRGAWCTLDKQEKYYMDKATKSVIKAYRVSLGILRDQIKDFDELCAHEAQDHGLLLAQSEVSALHESLEGFVDCLTLDQMVTILEVVDSLKGSTDKKKEIKLALLNRLNYQAPQGGWGEDYTRLLAWFKTRKEDMSEVVEIEANGHIGLDEDAMIAGIDARSRVERLMAQGIGADEAVGRILFGRRYEEEFLRDESDMEEPETVESVLEGLFVA